MSEQPTFWVRDVPVYGDVMLAPMARYSDVPTRALYRAYGSAMHYTEFVPAEALLTDTPNPQWRRLDVHPQGERPLVFQIFGGDARQILAAAQRIAAWGPDIIDVNMGCSVPKITEKGAGVGMMRQPKLVAETFRLLSRHLQMPVTGKIRLGWDDSSLNHLEIGRIMVDNGAALVAVHGRTRAQKYRGRADWDAIARLKQALPVPVIGNGDVKRVADIERMKAYTCCDAVMIGRAAVGNPWLLARQERAERTLADVTAVIRRHLAEMVAYYGWVDGHQIFIGHLRRYFKGLALKPWLALLLEAPDADTFDRVLGEMETAVAAAVGPATPLRDLCRISHLPLPNLREVC